MVKNNTFNLKNTSYKGFSRVFLVLLMVILMSISTVSALEWDNVKSYDDKTQTVTIKDSFLGIPTTTVATAELLTATSVKVEAGLDRKVAEIKVNLNEDSYDSWIKSIDSYNYNTMKPRTKDYYIKKRITNTKKVDLYEKVCGGTYPNGTTICNYEKTGTEDQVYYTWETFNYDTILKGELVVGIFTDVSEGEHTELIPEIFGVRVEEWLDFQAYTKIEYYDIVPTNKNNVGAGPGAMLGQNFTLGTTGTDGNYNLVGFALNMSGAATFNFSLYATDAGGKPTTMLVQNNSFTVPAAWSWYNITMPSYTLEAGTTYAIVFEATGGQVYARQTGATYTGGVRLNDGLVPLSGSDFMFRVYGETLPVPNINLERPVNNYNSTFLPIVEFNCSANSSTNNIQNITLSLGNGSSWTVVGDAQNLSLQQNISFVEGNYTWNCSAYNDITESTISENRNISVLQLIERDQTYNNRSGEGVSQRFQINVSTSKPIIAGYLIYNNTEYTGTITNPQTYNYSITKTVTTPFISADKNISFYWNLIKNDYTEYNSTKLNQTVINIAFDDCSAYGTVLLNMTLKDEINLQTLGGTTNNTEIDVDLYLYTYGGTSLISQYSNNFTKINSASICLNNDLSTTNYSLSALIQYYSSDREVEFYNLQNTTLTNSTIPINISLYDLNSSKSQPFKINYKDSNFVAVPGALIQIQRKYVNDGVFRTVEQPITDSEGSTIAHLQVEDTIYTIIVSKNGVVLDTFSNVVALCQNPTYTDCIINLNSFASSVSTKEYNTGDDFAYTLLFNTTSRNVTSTFSIPSGTSATVTLNVTMIDGLGTTQVCSKGLVTPSGTLVCTIPTNVGNGTAIVKLLKNNVLVGNALIDLSVKPSVLYGSSLAFLGLFLMITLIGLGISNNPMITTVFAFFGVVLLIALNLIDTGTSSYIGNGATILWLFIAIVIILIKGAKRI